MIIGDNNLACTQLIMYITIIKSNKGDDECVKYIKNMYIINIFLAVDFSLTKALKHW